MNTALRVFITLAVGLATFGVAQRFLKVSVPVSALLASGAAVLTGLVSMADKALELTKKSLEVRKALREERERNRIVKLATPDEIREFGQSLVERTLRERYRVSGSDAIESKGFVSETREGAEL